MKERTTISLNGEYLTALKSLADRRNSSVSRLINEAISGLLSKGDREESGLTRRFFSNLKKLGRTQRISRRQLDEFVEMGRK